jgi:hypothetical protein
MAIPHVIHLIWLGARLPALAWLAARSLLARAQATRVILHADDAALTVDPLVINLLQQPNFSLDLAPPILTDLPLNLQRTLADLMTRLQKPAAKADLLRLEILWAEGGLYVDTDVIALHPLAPLWALDGVAGVEHVCLPAAVVHSRSPLKWARAGVLVALREGIRHLPNAAAHFRRVASFYDEIGNNAVMGFPRHSPVVLRLLQRIAAMPAAQALELYELGPRLLETETQNHSIPGLTLLPPPAFFPLAPEICGALLRRRPRNQPLQPEPQTLLIHLYDSVLARQLGHAVDAKWLLGPGRRSWLAELVEPWLPELAQLTGN